MEFDKRTILAILLIGVVLIFVQTEFYQKKFLPKSPPKAIEESRSEPEIGQQTAFESQEVKESDKISKSSWPEQQKVENKNQSEQLLETSVTESKEIVIETNLYKAVFSNLGATIRSWQLKNYLGPDSASVQLIGEDGYGDLALLLPTSEDTIDTSPYAFSFDKKEIILTGAEDQESLQFILNLDEERQIKKTYTFYQNKYSIDLKVELINLNSLVEGFSYYLTWKTGLRSTEPDLKADMESAKGFVFQGDKEEFSIGDEVKQEVFDNPTDWVAIRTKYFANAVIPRSVRGQAVKFKGRPVNIGQEVALKKYSFDLKMPFDQKQERTDDYTIYLGPLDYDIVKSYEVGLEEMMDLGWTVFRPFGKFVLWSFTLLHEVIPNYGFVIIIFSILIKIVLFPLTKKSYQSMKEMQALQPLMQELNEKYKNDPQKKQQETMKLYKEYGINPLGGCIPMALQMPLLIALFNVFRSTIELRGASFIWWMTDLSRPDTVAVLPFSVPLYGNTVNILPLFMGVTMFIQQKMSMKDPKQKAMVYIMPVFFTLLFNSFPSGLNLYYALFNLLTILQEKLIPLPTKSLEDLKKGKKSVQTKRRIKHDYRGRSYKKM